MDVSVQIYDPVPKGFIVIRLRDIKDYLERLSRVEYDDALERFWYSVYLNWDIIYLEYQISKIFME